MPHIISICDAVNLDKSSPAFDLSFLDENITIRELIRSRVFQEVKDFNAERPEYFRGLIQPNETEQTLNGFAFKKARREIDWEEQYNLAVTAFEAGRFLILINDTQVTGIDTPIQLGARCEAVFMKLTPLVGG